MKLKLELYLVFSWALLAAAAGLYFAGIASGNSGQTLFVEWDLGLFRGARLVISLILD